MKTLGQGIYCSLPLFSRRPTKKDTDLEGLSAALAAFEMLGHSDFYEEPTNPAVVYS